MEWSLKGAKQRSKIMNQIILAIFFVVLMFETSSAFDCPKCKQEMPEKDGTVTCPKCGFSAKVNRISIYNDRTVEEKIKTIEEEKKRKPKEFDENVIKESTKVNKDAEYNSKLERIKEIKKRIEWLEGELRTIQDEMIRIEWQRPGQDKKVLTKLRLRHAELKRRREGIQESIRTHELEIETIRRSL